MNVQALAVGLASLFACLILFLLEKTTPKTQRVPVRPFITYSHEQVSTTITMLFIIGVILITAGLIL